MDLVRGFERREFHYQFCLKIGMRANNIRLHWTSVHVDGPPNGSIEQADGSAQEIASAAVLDMMEFYRYMLEWNKIKCEKIGRKLLIGRHGAEIELCFHIPGVSTSMCVFCKKVFTDSNALIDHLLLTRRNPHARIVNPTRYIEYMNSYIQPLVDAGSGSKQGLCLLKLIEWMWR